MGIRYKDSNKSLLVYREYSIETNSIKINNIESNIIRGFIRTLLLQTKYKKKK